jgi:endonuclease YncB( thermonuclease family)
MTPKLRAPVFLAFLVLAAGTPSAFAGDSLYGRLRSVSKSAEVVTLAYGECVACKPGEYQVRIAGIRVSPSLQTRARALILHLIPLGEFARMRLVRREGSEMVSQLLTGDITVGIKDVGLELLRNGLAVLIQPNSDTFYRYKYGELTAAEQEARTNGVGFWAGTHATATPVPPTPVPPTPTPTPVPPPPIPTPTPTPTPVLIP